jgi:signal transduction histidine kinase/ligand-binding sensor domain-containing protein
LEYPDFLIQRQASLVLMVNRRLTYLKNAIKTARSGSLKWQVYFVAITFAFLLYSCGSQTDDSSREDRLETSIPITKSFEFGPEIKLDWEIRNVNAKTEKADFSLNKNDTRPFEINSFKSISSESSSHTFSWNDIENEGFGMDSALNQPYTFKKYILPEPVLSKIENPAYYEGSSNGLMQFVDEKRQLGSSITAIIEDKDGINWIASENGLTKISGGHIHTYDIFNQEGNSYERVINKMAVDKSGKIWLATAGLGLFVVDTKESVILKDNLNHNFWNVLVDHNGLIWAGAYEGLFIINPEELTYKWLFSTEEEIKGNYPFILEEDGLNNIWIGHQKSVSILNLDRRLRKRIGQKEGLDVEFVIKFLESDNGEMFVGNLGKGLTSISLAESSINRISNENGFYGTANDILIDALGRHWLFQNDSMFVYKPKEKKLKKIVTNAKADNGRQFAHHYIDNSGLIWIGTVDKGLLFLDSNGPLPQHLNISNNAEASNVFAIKEDKEGLIWLGSEQGVDIIDPKSGKIKSLHDFGTKSPSTKVNPSRIIQEISPTQLMVGFTNFGFVIIDKTENTVTKYSKSQGVPANISSAIKGLKEDFWFMSNGGIYNFDLNSKQLKSSTMATPIGESSHDILMDNLGQLWVGTEHGLLIINLANNTAKTLSEKEGLCHNEVLKLHKDDDGHIWVGTLDGISVIDTKSQTICNLGKQHGLSQETIFDLQSEGNKIFAGSNDGVIVINKPKESSQAWPMIAYGKREGYPFTDYMQMTAASLKNGALWWGVPPMLTINNQVPQIEATLPKVNITQVKILEEQVDFGKRDFAQNQLTEGDSLWNFNESLYLNNGSEEAGNHATLLSWDSLSSGFKLPLGLQLPYNRNVIQFSFHNEDLLGIDRKSYYYTLEGNGELWSRNTVENESQNFYNLSPGVYTFKVYTKGFSDSWSKPDELTFTVNPPWWQTWWAYTIFTILIASLLRAYIVFRSRNLVRANKKLEEKVSKRTKALSLKTNELEASLAELKSTQAQLIQSEKMASLGELTAGIAHEIQNPLNFVNNFSEVSEELLIELEEELTKGEIEEAKVISHDVIQNLQKIQYHGKRASSIVKGMLEHSRTSSGKKELTDINALADEYLRLSYHGLRAKDKDFNAEMVTDFDKEMPKIEVIPQDIGRVLLNLINNAFQAVHEVSATNTEGYKPKVTVTTELTANSQLLIAIKDNGPGIPDELKDKIFQPFFTTKETGKGTGLGLSLAYDIVKANGGEIKVSNTDVSGTTFEIILPQTNL